MNHADVPRIVNRQRISLGLISAFVIVALVAAGAGSYVTHHLVASTYADEEKNQQEPGDESFKQTNEDWQRFWKVFSLVESEFVNGVDEEALWTGAIAGIVRAVQDPYSSYLDMRELQNLLEQTSGSYVGIGVVLTQINEYAVIVSPFPDTPAGNAGLMPMDKVLSVDGRSVIGMPLEGVVSLIRGPEGTEVTLTIGRDDEELDVVVARAVITIPTVIGEMKDDSTGYIRLTHFSWNTIDEVEQRLNEFEEQGMTGLVLDLRGNPGGDLEVCVQIAGLFVPEGPVVYLIDKDGEYTTYSSSGEGIGVPVVVLVDEGTGSSSEILAGAIRDRGVGILLGTQTFGKASVQTIFPLDEGTAVKLTTARYLTPDYVMIDGVGLVPDIHVVADEDSDEDIQLEEALLYLSGRR